MVAFETAWQADEAERPWMHPTIACTSKPHCSYLCTAILRHFHLSIAQLSALEVRLAEPRDIVVRKLDMVYSA